MSRSDLLPGAGPVLSVAQALYRAGRDHKGGVTALALEMGVDYDSLQKKLHIKDEKRYLSPSELEEVVAFTRDQRLLAALVHPAGRLHICLCLCRPLRMPCVPWANCSSARLSLW